MTLISYNWKAGNACDRFDLAFVRGTAGHPYLFGDPNDQLAVQVDDFYIGTLPVTQALWTHIMGDEANPSICQGRDLPVENVSWNEIAASGGFLDRVNQSSLLLMLQEEVGPSIGKFRLPSETEWEYAARGGPCWTDGFRFSGSDEIDAVAWYERRHGDHTQPAGRKKPNQLGIFDMSGNVWEWCQDVYTQDVANIPADGTPYVGCGEERVLRGGCFHNWAIHCTVSKRYEIAQSYRDGCIGFRLVLALDSSR